MELLKQHVGHIKLEANNRKSHIQVEGQPVVLAVVIKTKEGTVEEHEHVNIF